MPWATVPRDKLSDDMAQNPRRLLAQGLLESGPIFGSPQASGASGPWIASAAYGFDFHYESFADD